MTDLLTLKEAASLLRVSRSTFANLRKLRGFPSPLKIGSRKMYRGSELFEWLMKQR